MSTRFRINRRHFLACATLGVAGLAGAASLKSAAIAQAVNPIITENNLPGSTGWDITNAADDTMRQIKGYASATSVNKGDALNFYVSVSPSQNYTMEIYRIGWYNGTGGRLVQTVGPLSATPQVVPAPDALGMVACNWPVAYTLNVPNSWTSGVYLVKLTNSNGWQNYIHFVVRDDARTADLLFQCSVTTYQAYNNFGGKSLYKADSSNGVEARKVSFDRPYSSNGASNFYTWEMPLLRFIEKNGYDVTYCTNLDLHSNAALMNNRKAFLSVGHDEYWTMAMYDHALAFRNQGKHLAFFSANSVYWQIRLESSAGGAPNRVVVGYKDNYLEDPQYPGPTTTYLWRELPPNEPLPQLSRPENMLVGLMYDSYLDGATGQPFVVTNSNHWVYAGTGFSNGSSVPGIVGYEWDKRVNNGLEPAGLVSLSNSPVVDLAGVHSVSNASIYQHSSGAWVFGTGTIYWAYALDFCGYQTTDLRNAGIQRTTLNVLNRFITNPPTPTKLTSLSPASVVQMESGFTLTVNGSNFGSGSVINWNGSARPTTFVNSGQLTAQINNSDLLVAGNYPVTVTNPDGSSSNALNFSITVPVVNQPNDGGEQASGKIYGTLSYALKHTRNGDTIVFSSLGNANKVNVTGSLPPVPAGITLDGGNCGSTPVIIDGKNGGPGLNGLVLSGNVKLKNIIVQNFSGRQIVNASGGNGNSLICSIARKTGV